MKIKIKIDKNRLRKLIDLFVECEDCPAKNKECMYYKGTLFTKDCTVSIIEWLKVN